MKYLLLRTLLLGVLLFTSLRAAEDRKALVLDDRTLVKSDTRWIYNDLLQAYAEAKRTGKPLLVVIRCVPCVACRAFDEQVVHREPTIASVMDKFVCVRIVQANGLDLSIFKYDYDLSFSVFFMNADKTVYGRFGTRSDRQDTTRDITLEGFRKGMERALELHAGYPANASLFKGKVQPMRFAVPEEYPSFKGKYTAQIDFEGKLLPSCIHCHMVGEAERDFVRKTSGTLPDQNYFPYPMPDVIGVHLDPKDLARVESVTPGSIAAKAGLKPGDEIATLEGQPMLSIADVQWVLHHAGDSAKLRAGILRNGKKTKATLNLPAGWRTASDLSWRVSTWALRGSYLGGLVIEDLGGDARKSRGIAPDKMALNVNYVGQYGNHAAAKKAGFQKDDVIVAVDGHTEHWSEALAIRHLMQSKKAGESARITLLRGTQTLELPMPVQE